MSDSSGVERGFMMRTSQDLQSSTSMQSFYFQPMQGTTDPYFSPPFQILHNGMSTSQEIGSQVTKLTSPEQYFTLDSSSAASGFVAASDSPSVVSQFSGQSPFSMQGSKSFVSDPIHSSSDNHYGSPISASSVANEDIEQWHKLKELEILLLGPEADTSDSSNFCVTSGLHNQCSSYGQWNRNQMLEIIPRLDLKQLLVMCAEAVSESDTAMTAATMEELEKRVSVSGDPILRVGAYMLEGLRARLESSGSLIYRKLRCVEPTSSELMSYMSVLYQVCPYWRFAYESANVVIEEAIWNEPRVHIIDFQIAQGTQWTLLMQRLKSSGGRLPCIRVTGVDDSQSAHARGGGLEVVGRRLAHVAESCGFQFEFHNAAMSGHEVVYENLGLRPGEAIMVNFPYVLHHMPDESVSVENHRDRLLRLVKRLSPKVVTLVEQESNTNTAPFLPRFREMFDYYLAMFESIDAGTSRDNKQRVSAEQHCVARDIVNMIACEGSERVERHELLGKWRMRLSMAGFHQLPLSPRVMEAVRSMLRQFSGNYRVEEQDGALYLWWLNRAMATSSAWR
ncbi:hypothetical protein SAY86_030895 [Trapa natans]|uniref:Scarecrow-like protein 13 n=1 Tax=Trapa natans TaxID=22666 RepID=A0AAN7M5V5_TRANT|nr:hypothetical protein SAY86_030895 [Trapa natans]